MRCLFVCVSVTFVHSVKTNKHIFEIFSLSVATSFWFFRIKRYDKIPTGTLLTGASNAGGMKNSRFSANISFYLRNNLR